MRTINGWTEKEIDLLIARTARSVEAITRFCRAVDKQLYMLLPSHIKRATLHFHLGQNSSNKSEPKPRDCDNKQYALSQNMTPLIDTDAKDETKNIIFLQDYRRKKL